MSAGSLRPGLADPNRPADDQALADRLGVEAADVGRWCADGLARRPDGLLDPLAAVNWLTWGRLDRCPVLARRWRTWLGHFAPFARNADSPRRVRARRRHRLCLPGAWNRLSWWLPLPPDELPGQVAVSGIWPAAAEPGPGWRLLQLPHPAETAIEAVEEWSLAPVRVEADAGLLADVEEIAAGFRYGYRRHRAEDLLALPHEPPEGGSCLDCALALACRLRDRGRRWRLRAGVVAHPQVANPHLWIEAEAPGGGWIPLDPSLPAIARIIGSEDWRSWARAWTGGCDARRVTVGVWDPQDPVAGLPAGTPLGGALGMLEVEDSAGRHEAWSCLDWVCGECGWAIG